MRLVGRMESFQSKCKIELEFRKMNVDSAELCCPEEMCPIYVELFYEYQVQRSATLSGFWKTYMRNE